MLRILYSLRGPFVSTYLTRRQYVISTSSPLVTGALHQALIGLLSNYRIAREAQLELDTLNAKPKVSPRAVESLPILKAIIAESMRLGLSTATPEVWYRSMDHLWYKKWFIPKGSIVILDRQIPYTNPVFLDRQVRFAACLESNGSFVRNDFWRKRLRLGMLRILLLDMDLRGRH